MNGFYMNIHFTCKKNGNFTYTEGFHLCKILSLLQICITGRNIINLTFTKGSIPCIKDYAASFIIPCKL